MKKDAALSPQVTTRIHESFAAQAMMATLGARLVDVGPGRVRIEAPILPGSRQQHGFAHAGLSFAIGDSAAGYAALSVMPEGYEVLTTEMKIHLLAPAKGELLVAEGRVLRPGRRLVIVEADIHALEDGRETHVARLIGTMIPLAP
ncbi:phenylacetic acid degradation protein [Roseovarius sp. A46]|uniref:PaaI family thioesterase n=1 Tax=Roseovarius sp. A46 TaxID=2109331 RepID=UPI001013ADC9|nr:PaaI family thioesterase [Roseovarius sp. A46]RXV64052.1 phenylacetic acid degradation protein [Roseovarius sp. A46]